MKNRTSEELVIRKKRVLEGRPCRRSAMLNQKGVALVIALIITLVVFLLIASTLYVVTLSSEMSGIGKRYVSASEAADGSVNVVKDSINLAMGGDEESITDILGSCSEGRTIKDAILNENQPCTAQITLPSATIGASYVATVSVVRLYSVSLPGGRLEFARSASGVASTAIFYRITTIVTGPDNATAENSVLYRFAG